MRQRPGQPWLDVEAGTRNRAKPRIAPRLDGPAQNRECLATARAQWLLLFLLVFEIGDWRLVDVLVHPLFLVLIIGRDHRSLASAEG